MEPWLAASILGALGAGLGGIWGGAWAVFRHAARSTAAGTAALAARLDQVLPQLQCGQCGYGACRPYAEALARGEADIDRCPPGGLAGSAALARLLGCTPKPPDPARQTVAPGGVAVIDEAECIGCARCLAVCPVDAILGAAKQMHSVLTQECNGCGLCLPACPVDCIELRAHPGGHACAA